MEIDAGTIRRGTEGIFVKRHLGGRRNAKRIATTTHEHVGQAR
jgi:hypothetical protein